ncbi:MAG: nuclear transport factor 2 family protein [Alteromonadaceae bacterium]|nr:nuclear transport factor 2 family protein [Alteromonadaceae bacterium]
MKFTAFFSAVFVCFSSIADEPKSIVKEFVAAFNEKNVAAMLKHADPKIRWMSIQVNELTIEAESKTALGTAMQGYFQSVPSAQSEIVNIFTNQNFVSTIEKATWSNNGVAKSQCSIGVYELKNDKILNVWYYPAQPC